MGKAVVRCRLSAKPRKAVELISKNIKVELLSKPFVVVIAIEKCVIL